MTNNNNTYIQNNKIKNEKESATYNCLVFMLGSHTVVRRWLFSNTLQWHFGAEKPPLAYTVVNKRWSREVTMSRKELSPNRASALRFSFRFYCDDGSGKGRRAVWRANAHTHTLKGCCVKIAKQLHLEAHFDRNRMKQYPFPCWSLAHIP